MVDRLDQKELPYLFVLNEQIASKKSQSKKANCQLSFDRSSSLHLSKKNNFISFLLVEYQLFQNALPSYKYSPSKQSTDQRQNYFDRI